MGDKKESGSAILFLSRDQELDNIAEEDVPLEYLLVQVYLYKGTDEVKLTSLVRNKIGEVVIRNLLIRE